MGTRSIIAVRGPSHRGNWGDHSVIMYRSLDGYPTGILPSIKKAITKSQKVLEQHKKSYGRSEPICVELLSSQIYAVDIGYSGSEYDFESKNKAFNIEQVNTHWDVAWIYIIDIKAKNILIYENCEVLNIKDTTDLEEVYKEDVDEVNTIRKIVNDLLKIGFTVNCNKTNTMKLLEED